MFGSMRGFTRCPGSGAPLLREQPRSSRAPGRGDGVDQRLEVEVRVGPNDCRDAVIAQRLLRDRADGGNPNVAQGRDQLRLEAFRFTIAIS